VLTLLALFAKETAAKRKGANPFILRSGANQGVFFDLKEQSQEVATAFT